MNFIDGDPRQYLIEKRDILDTMSNKYNVNTMSNKSAEVKPGENFLLRYVNLTAEEFHTDTIVGNYYHALHENNSREKDVEGGYSVRRETLNCSTVKRKIGIHCHVSSIYTNNTHNIKTIEKWRTMDHDILSHQTRINDELTKPTNTYSITNALNPIPNAFSLHILPEKLLRNITSAQAISQILPILTNTHRLITPISKYEPIRKPNSINITNQSKILKTPQSRNVLRRKNVNKRNSSENVNKSSSLRKEKFKNYYPKKNEEDNKEKRQKERRKSSLRKEIFNVSRKNINKQSSSLKKNGVNGKKEQNSSENVNKSSSVRKEAFTSCSIKNKQSSSTLRKETSTKKASLKKLPLLHLGLAFTMFSVCLPSARAGTGLYTGPYFRDHQPLNITVHQDSTAYLPCVVKQLGDKKVSFKK